MQIQIEIPEGLNIEHLKWTILDALDFSDNVTEEEYNLIENILCQLNSKPCIPTTASQTK
jgi:hypothetical protein